MRKHLKLLPFDKLIPQFGLPPDPPRPAPTWHCDWCQRDVTEPFIGTLVACYRDKRHICQSCYDALAQGAGVRVCWDCKAFNGCKYLGR
jgi:hypothetical protein